MSIVYFIIATFLPETVPRNGPPKRTTRYLDWRAACPTWPGRAAACLRRAGSRSCAHLNLLDSSKVRHGQHGHGWHGGTGGTHGVDCTHAHLRRGFLILVRCNRTAHRTALHAAMADREMQQQPVGRKPASNCAAVDTSGGGGNCGGGGCGGGGGMSGGGACKKGGGGGGLGLLGLGGALGLGGQQQQQQRWRGAARGVVASWQCLWGLAMAAFMLLYALAIFGSAPPLCGERRPGEEGVVVVGQAARRAASAGGGGGGGGGWDAAGAKGAATGATGTGAWAGDLRELETAWNRLCFGPPAEALRVALFVKKWPVGGTPGGLERHAMTLHRVLAERGHTVHVFTTSTEMAGQLPQDIEEEVVDEAWSSDAPPPPPTPAGRPHLPRGKLLIHVLKPNPGGAFDYGEAWAQYLRLNSTTPGGIDCVHSESVALPHWRAREVPRLVASWHGIAYETIHSDIVADLVRKPGEARSPDLQRTLAERLARVSDEVRFFPGYSHHVATSDYVGDVLRTIYQLPRRNVHTILNGVDARRFQPDPAAGAAFRARHGVPRNATLVMGAAGRLVRDKGHPLLFDALAAVLRRHDHRGVYLLVAGHGPWGDRYRELAPNAMMLGSMAPAELAHFYNAIDVFVNPTLRSQGLDHTLLEAMQCGKPLLATHFSSITWSVVVSQQLGYTFSPNVDALTAALLTVIRDGRDVLRRKGLMCRHYANLMFTATKMGSAYERLFLCIHNQTYCQYPLPWDCPTSADTPLQLAARAAAAAAADS